MAIHLYSTPKGVCRAYDLAMCHAQREAIASLKWDGTPRLDRLFLDYMPGAGIQGYRRDCARVLMASAVTRAFGAGPGSYPRVVLEGPQGTGKSMALRILFEPFLAEDVVAELVDTTNDSASPRANRRYLPIKVRAIALGKLKADRDQIFAEAYTIYKDGKKDLR